MTQTTSSTAALAQTAARPWVLSPLGDSCLLLTAGQAFTLESNRRVAHWARQLDLAVTTGELVGVTDIVPAMVSLAVHYRPERVACPRDECPFEALGAQINTLLSADAAGEGVHSRLVDIPVCYGGEHGPDLHDVAALLDLTPARLIELHANPALDVLMVGFAPGHPYIGMLDERLNPPRKATPRTRVAVGSIGLANRQSVIYPLELPGGWNLIGRTPLKLFDAYRPEPCLLRSGDRVRFVAIDSATFDAISQEG